MVLHENLDINEKGHLTIGGADSVDLASKYGTALMVIDENRVRRNCKIYETAMREYFGEGSMALYASKALCFKEMYRIAASEGIGADIVSPGELYTAASAGFPMEKAFFHGNNKTDADIALALDKSIGYFIVDNREELVELNRQAGERGIVQKILLRATPGIDPHTHAKINTGKVDSKFGTAIETGQLTQLVEFTLTLKNISLEGFHCHIGSQIFDIDPFCDAADIMLDYINECRSRFGLETKILNLGGGFGVRYTENDPIIDYEENIRGISEHIKAKCALYGLTMPKILLEPGRSLVADAGVTLYTVGSVKHITGYKSYVSIDGGMTDNPRYTLYGSEYTFLIANKAKNERDLTCTIAGRCCESGDLLGENVTLQTPVRGDILAVLVTGAYNYAMASNYNRVARPAIVLVKDGEDRLAVKRESLEHLASLDI